MRPEWRDAESGRVRSKKGRIDWRLTLDEADEIASFIEASTSPKDAARRDAEALRRAINDAREDMMLPPLGVER